MKNAIIVVVVLAVIGGGAYALTQNSDKPAKTNTTSSTTPKKSTNSTAATSDQTSAATITYSDSGFSPSSVTVKAGSTVTIKNTSSRMMQFDSDPHPAHTDDMELNAGGVASGESQTVKVEKKGTFGYHNHLNPSDTGTIIVE